MTTHAPHAIDLVIDFVNTLDIEAGTDELATPDDLARWFAAKGLLGAGAHKPSADDRDAAIRLREALRALMLEQNGGPRDERSARELEHAARRGDLGVAFAADGSVLLRPGHDDLAGALAAVLVPVAHGASDGSWLRAKACRASDCQWAFYDRSRNRSGTWCDMAVCGNRTKVRAYRQRAPG